GLEQGLEILDHGEAPALESGTIGSVRSGQRAGMGQRCRGARRAVRNLVDDDRLIGGRSLVAEREQSFAGFDALEAERDGAAGGLLDEVAREVADIDVAGNTGRKIMAEA